MEKSSVWDFLSTGTRRSLGKIDELYPLYRELELPVSLEQMGLFPKDKQIIDKMAEFIDSKEKVHLIPIEVTQKSLIQSMMELEGYIRKI